MQCITEVSSVALGSTVSALDHLGGGGGSSSKHMALSISFLMYVALAHSSARHWVRKCFVVSGGQLLLFLMQRTIHVPLLLPLLRLR